MQYRYQKKLQTIYDEYLIKHNETGLKPYPDKLLALLLFQEKDNYTNVFLSTGKFYEYYQSKIDEKIEKVINDFNFTKDDIITYIEQKGIFHEEIEYEHNKIWFVFVEGFSSVQWSMMYHKSWSPEKAYAECLCLFEGQNKKEFNRTRRKTLKKINY